MQPLLFTFSALISASTVALGGPTTAPVIDLTPGNVPGVTAAQAVDAVREGTHFVSRTGKLTHAEDGQQAIFVFENDGASTKAPPMLVLQNQNFQMMESMAPGKAAAPSVTISGTVTEYRGRNYILIDNAQSTSVTTATPAVKIAAAAAAPKETATPALQTIGQKSTPVKTNGISSDQMMNHLLDSPPQSGAPIRSTIATGPGVTTDASTGHAAVGPDAPALKTQREGTVLNNRIGRLNHSSDGQQATFTFDADGKTMQDPPVIILPNLKLTAMEGAVLSKASDVHFRISGTLSEYKGRNYILLDKAVAIADVEVPF